MSPAIPAEVGLSIVKDLITAVANYQMCKEQERTKRLQIEAQLEACLTAINKNHAQYDKIFAANHEYAMKAYAAAENLLSNPAVTTNANILQQVLNFLQNAHKTASGDLVSLANAISSMPLPKIG